MSFGQFCKCDADYGGDQHRENCPMSFAYPAKENQLQRFDATMRKSMDVLRRFFVPLPDGVSPYLERLILDEYKDTHGQPGKVYLHVIYASDGDRDPHCHPFDFESTIVWGRYVEHAFVRWCPDCSIKFVTDVTECSLCKRKLSCKEDGHRTFAAGHVNEKKAHHLHKLTLPSGPVVTLVSRGPKLRRWGFMTQDGWVDHEPYIKEKFPDAQPTEVGD